MKRTTVLPILSAAIIFCGAGPLACDAAAQAGIQVQATALPGAPQGVGGIAALGTVLDLGENALLGKTDALPLLAIPSEHDALLSVLPFSPAASKSLESVSPKSARKTVSAPISVPNGAAAAVSDIPDSRSEGFQETADAASDSPEASAARAGKTFDRSSGGSELLASGALAVELPVGSRTARVHVDVATQKLMKHLPAGVTLTIFGSQILDMLREDGSVARTGVLHPASDVDLYVAGPKVPNLEKKLKAAYAKEIDVLPHIFNLFDIRPESWAARSQFHDLTRAYSHTQLAVSFTSLGHGKFASKWALPQKKAAKAYADWEQGIVRYVLWRSMSFAQAMLGLRLASRTGGVFDPKTQEQVIRALRSHAREGFFANFLDAVLMRWAEENPEFMAKVFRRSVDPGWVLSFLHQHGLFKGAMRWMTLQGLKDSGRKTDALSSPSLPPEIRSLLQQDDPS
ncbi:MAG: hypothetical protein WCU88_09095 [Elusimicrobiota bacterium]